MNQISLFDPQSVCSTNKALRSLIEDPSGAYQLWRKKEVPFYEMCKAVVLTLAGEQESGDNAVRIEGDSVGE